MRTAAPFMLMGMMDFLWRRRKGRCRVVYYACGAKWLEKKTRTCRMATDFRIISARPIHVVQGDNERDTCSLYSRRLVSTVSRQYSSVVASPADSTVDRSLTEAARPRS